MEKLITLEELASIREKYEELRFRNGGDAVHNPDALAALSLVERLLKDADGWTHTWVEEAVFFDGTDPDNCAKAICDIPDVLDVRDIHEWARGAGLARRECRAYGWVVLEEPDEDDD